MPANLGFAEAAAIPLVGLTAWQSLFDAAGVRAGQTVLIHAAGGVGGMAIQFAKSVGAFVFATASAANHDYVRSLGADRVIDYRVEDFVDAVRSVVPDGVDAVLATVGGEVLARSYDAVKRGGVLVSIVDAPNGERAKETGVRHAYVFVEPNGDQLREIARLIETGRVRPPAITEMRLEDAATAQIRSREGHVRGKIVLKIA